MIIIGSIVVYPIRNLEYIDALFFASCMSTQAGLNTVDINKTTLYQQLIFYLWPMFTTPIFIHSAVVFLRLYWFEKRFKGIKENSKIQSRMRRTATMAKYGSLDPSNGDVELGHLRTPNKLQQRRESEEDDHEKAATSSSSSKDDDALVASPPTAIKFGDLPHPKRNTSIAPKDMYMSINMMQRNRRDSNDVGEGPALVIKSPRAMDEEHEKQERLASRAPSLSSQPISDDDDDDDDDEEVDPNELQRSQSHDVSSSGIPMDNSGVKFAKRSHTIEGTTPAEDDSDSGPHKEDGVTFANSASRGRKFRDRLPRLGGVDGARRRQRKRVLRRSNTFERALSAARQRLVDRENESEEGSTNGLRRAMSANYLSWEPTIGRNSQFVDLTEEQKEELGGIEYRALKLLARILIGYYVGLHLLGALMLLPWAVLTTKYRELIRADGISPAWWAFFTAQSAFNDVGFTLTPDSMSSFTHAAYVLLTMSFFIVVGNTGFPCLLRLVIWILFKLSPKFGRTHESLAFLLDHPRRCFTLLFPGWATWWLFAILVIMNAVDLIFFIILDLNNPAVTELPVAYRIISGLFEAFSTRTAGFSAISPGDLHAGIQVSYMVMMYISVLPIAISIRRTNVYEEQSLGIYYERKEEDEQSDQKTEEPSYVSNHLRRQLSFDLWYIVLGLFIITIAEGSKIGNQKMTHFDTFAILFEIVSAYGTVGLSMGYPGSNTSFCAQFGVIGKLVIIAMMIRGRHRGLPYALDRAIMLPNDRLKRTDTMQETNTRNRLMRRSSTMNSTGDAQSDTGDTRQSSSGIRRRMRRMSVSTILSTTPTPANRPQD
jgi:potassium uptake Trk family protein